MEYQDKKILMLSAVQAIMIIQEIQKFNLHGEDFHKLLLSLLVNIITSAPNPKKTYKTFVVLACELGMNDELPLILEQALSFRVDLESGELGNE